MLTFMVEEPMTICASGNIDPKPRMSHYIPCLIAE
jgi:hypothetical protein